MESIDFCCFLSFSCRAPTNRTKKYNNKNTTNVALQYNFPYDFVVAFSYKPFKGFIHSVRFFSSFFIAFEKKFLTLILVCVRQSSSRTKKHWIWSTNSWAIPRSVSFTFHLDISWLCACACVYASMPTTVAQALIHDQKKKKRKEKKVKIEKLPMWTKKINRKRIYVRWTCMVDGRDNETK